jgi:hypothetical protein
MIAKSTIGVILFLVSSVSIAGFTTGNELYQSCVATRSDQFYFQKSARCAAYISGVFDEIISEPKGRRLCLDSNITRGQVVKVFVAYADRNPRLLNKPANNVVSAAILNAFKCQ